jgi:FG-GAP repeat
LRRLTLAVVLAAAGLLLPPGEPVVAQPTTLPVPDFDNDGLGDLAVGAPGETVGGRAGTGAVSVVFGSAGSGLGGGQFLSQGTSGLGGAAESGDAVAAALG